MSGVISEADPPLKDLKIVADIWADLRGEYEEPTQNELAIIVPYVWKSYFERDDFVEDDKWRSLEEKRGIPNLRPLLLKTLHQIRESKGYDVESNAGGIFHFLPANKYRQEDLDEPMKAVRVAIDAINSEMETMDKAYHYRLVNVDNFVNAYANHCYLLTLTVEEVAVDGQDVVMADAVCGAALKSIRAMVFAPPYTPPYRAVYKLLEWKFK